MSNLPEVSTALAEKNHYAFLPRMEADVPVVNDGDGPAVQIGDNLLPLLDKDFKVTVVQPGHVAKDTALAQHMGKIVFEQWPDKDEHFDRLYLMPITIISEGLRYFDKYEGPTADNSLLCYSMDGIAPSAKVIAPMHGVCSQAAMKNGQPSRKIVCPKAQWGPNGEKPNCREYIEAAFLDLERELPCRITFHGTGMRAWNKIWSDYRTLRNVARLKKTGVNGYMIVLTLENRGNYYEPKLEFMKAEAMFGDITRYMPAVQFYLRTLYTRAPEEPEVGETTADVELSSKDTEEASPTEVFDL